MRTAEERRQATDAHRFRRLESKLFQMECQFKQLLSELQFTQDEKGILHRREPGQKT